MSRHRDERGWERKTRTSSGFFAVFFFFFEIAYERTLYRLIETVAIPMRRVTDNIVRLTCSPWSFPSTNKSNTRTKCFIFLLVILKHLTIIRHNIFNMTKITLEKAHIIVKYKINTPACGVYTR